MCWKNIEPVYLDLLGDNRIWFGKDGSGVPRRKTFLSEHEGISPWTWWENTVVGHNQEAKKEVNQILGDLEGFDTPKPVRLIERILRIATKPDSFVLDSFAGSGTTAHAVMKLNIEDGGKRRFILVEMEDYAESLTAERVRRASKGYGEGDKAVAGLGSGFSYYKLGPRLFNESGFSEEAPRAARRAFVWYAETGTALEPRAAEDEGPCLGEKGGIAYYLIEGMFGKVALRGLRSGAEGHVVYGYSSTLGPEFLASRNIVFKKMPRDLPIEGSTKWS